MLKSQETLTCLGGCHCGSVRFQVLIDRCLDARTCVQALCLAPFGERRVAPASLRDFASFRSCGSHRLIADDCNCSICRQKGFLHLIVPKANFQLLRGQDCLSTYTFNTKVAQHTFCSVCSIHAFYTPRSHPDLVDINLRCLDRDIADKFTIRAFDGQNWEDNVAQIQD